MIEINNTGKVVTIKDSIDGQYKVVTINKGCTLQPREKFNIDTKVEITCSSDLDECWIWSDPIFDKTGDEVNFSDNIGILTHRITQEDGTYKVNLIGGYMGDQEVVIPKDAEIARIYTSLNNHRMINAEELKSNTLYQEEGIIIKTEQDFYGQYELVVEPNGERYLKVHLPS